MYLIILSYLIIYIVLFISYYIMLHNIIYLPSFIISDGIHHIYSGHRIPHIMSSYYITLSYTFYHTFYHIMSYYHYVYHIQYTLPSYHIYSIVYIVHIIHIILTHIYIIILYFVSYHYISYRKSNLFVKSIDLYKLNNFGILETKL